MFNIENKFVLNSVVKNQTDNNNDDLILTGIASTTKEPSLYGEVMTEDALQQMCEQAVNLPILEAHKGDGFDNVIGVITNAYVEDNDLHIDFKILQNHRQRIQELLDNNVPIGLSIGAQAMIEEDTQQVVGVTLIEVSLTPVPANRVAHNTVRVKEDYYTGDCLHGICYAMIKDNFKTEENNMAEEEKKVNPEEVVKEENDSLTIDKVKDMLDERFAEEKEVLVATVVEEVKTELKKLNDKVEETFKIEDAVKKEEKKSKAKGESEEEEDEEPKAGASEDNSESEEKPEAEGEAEGEGASKEEDEDKNKKDKKEVKESAPVIDEDKIVESITERILDSLGEKRDVTGTKTEAALKNDSTEEVADEVKPFTSEEAAKLIINDMNRRDPLARAINEAINQ